MLHSDAAWNLDADTGHLSEVRLGLGMNPMMSTRKGLLTELEIFYLFIWHSFCVMK